MGGRNCTGIKRYLVPKVVVGAAGARGRAVGAASNKGSTSMLILCKCVEIRWTGIQSVISEKQTLRGLYIHSARHFSSRSPASPLLTPSHYLTLSLSPSHSICEMRFSDIQVYIYHTPPIPVSDEIILCIYTHHRVKTGEKKSISIYRSHYTLYTLRLILTIFKKGIKTLREKKKRFINSYYIYICVRV